MSNSDTPLNNALESAVLSAIPAESLVTENLIYELYSIRQNTKPKEYPKMGRTEVLNQVKSLAEKKFLKRFSAYDVRNGLRLSR